MANWRVERWREWPSVQAFASQVEPLNMPVVYEGSIKSWPACSKWQPHRGGLHYLKGIAGKETVQAMLSTSGSNFYGDIRSHERVTLSFGEFLDYASDVCTQSEVQVEQGGCTDDERFNKHMLSFLRKRAWLYLAQASMFNKSEQESSPLRALMQDISMPSCLVSESVTNVNMWMSASESKSSTHYDPYHNILCVVLGQKQVTLWPPSATPFLYPYPVHGEASNHSSVDFAKPDGAMHPLFNHAMKLCQVVMLEPGDALFIPEGWYHQVNSERLTIAVNFWWPSMVALALNSHMDGYYLRRIVSSLLECEKKKNVQLATLGRVSGEPTNAVAANGFKQSADLDDCNSILGQVEANMHRSELNGEKGGMGMPHSGRKDAFEMLTALQQHCLRTLVVTCSSDENSNVVAERTGIQHGESSRNPRYLRRQALAILEMEHRKPADTMQEDNAVAHVLSILDSLALKQILLVMVEHFPRTLEVLVLKKLSPLAAELLTQRFDEMDTTFPESAQAEFYKAFFSVFKDQKAAMAALLDGKEAFSATALTSVLEGYLGSSCPLLSPPVDL